MAEWALQVMRLDYMEPMLDPGITLAVLVIALEFISWHLDLPRMFCMSL
jgi:hypothetical protein